MPFAAPAIDHADSLEALRQAVLDSYAILDTEPEQAFDDIVRLACTICDTPVGGVAFVDHKRQWLKASIGVGVRQLPRSEAIYDSIPHTNGGIVEIRDLHAEHSFQARPRDANKRELRFYAAVPLLSLDRHAIGTVSVLDLHPRTLTPMQREGLEALGRQTQHLLELRRYGLKQQMLLQERDKVRQRLEHDRAELQRQHEDLKHTANHDPLTGLLNRTALEELRARPGAMERLLATGYTLAVIDIDHFKLVNDNHGHLLGDRALRAVAEVITVCTREGDLAVRFGGEEFLLILPSTTPAIAFDIGERIRQQVKNVDLPFSISVSIGVAAGDPQRDTTKQVFERADQALYQAKSTGRDRVIVAALPSA